MLQKKNVDSKTAFKGVDRKKSESVNAKCWQKYDYELNHFPTCAYAHMLSIIIYHALRASFGEEHVKYIEL